MLDNSLENVVQVIFAECDKDKCNNVLVDDVLHFITPFLQSNISELLELEEALKENSVSGIISRPLFMETITYWSGKYKDCTGQLEDSFDGILPGRKSDINEKSFVHSTPRTSLGVLNHDGHMIQESLTTLNISSASCPDVRLNKTLLEDRIRDLEHINWRLTEANRKQKAQEQTYEDSIDGLKRELDLMKNKYFLAQRLIDSFNKIERIRNETSDNEARAEISQVELQTKYKSLQKDVDTTKVEFYKQLDELEYEKLQLEIRISELENIVGEFKLTVGNLEADIIAKKKKIELQRKENDSLLATNNNLSLNVTDLTKIIETFKSQQKKMEKNLRKSLCYNDKLQTSFNALQAVKAIGEYSNSKQAIQNISKPVGATNESIANVRLSREVQFTPPFKNSKFNFFDINSPKIRKSPSKDNSGVSIVETPTDIKDENNKHVNNEADLLNISSPPVMYVIPKTPPLQNVTTNSSFDYSEISCDEEAKFSHLEPRSPHMSIRTEMQEVLSCCCAKLRQTFDSEISVLNQKNQTLTTEKNKLRDELVEYTNLVSLLETDKTRTITSMRGLEWEVQSLKRKEFQTMHTDCANVSQVRQKDTFDKLKLKLEKYEYIMEAKQDDLNNIKMACEVYQRRLTENDKLINNIYLHQSSLSKLIRTVNEDLQTQISHFMEICHDELSNSPTKVVELLHSVIEVSKDDLNELSTAVLDFSRRISYVTEALRTLADSKTELNATIAASRPAAGSIQSSRFTCDSPDSPSTLLLLNKTVNQYDSTIRAEPSSNLDKNISGEQFKNLNIGNCNVATQTTTLETKLRTNGVPLPSVGILLAILYLLYESRHVHYRSERTM